MPALQNIQKHGKVLIAVVALALFAFIAEEGFRAMEQNSNANRNKVGEIDGEAISASDFEKLVDEYTEAMKFVQQRTSFTDEETTQIKDQVWQMLVNNKLVENECKKLGLTVTDEELQNIINEGNSPLLSQTPFIGQNGRFDKDMLKKFLADYEKTKTQNPQMAEQYAQVYKFWTFIEKMLRTQTLQMKYQALISNALISNPISAKASFENRTNQSDILMAAVPYSTINDNDVKIEEADYKAAYEKNKERFKNFAESRDIKYIDVLVKASPADRASLEEEMKEYVTKLANGEDATNVVRLSNSLVPYSDVFVSKHVLPGDIAGKIDSTAVGTVASTFYNAQDNTLNCYRYIAKASIPDSVEYQSIMVMGASKENVEDLKKYLGISIISYDKMNQLRHVKFFGTFENMLEHMKKHMAIIAPKFRLVCDVLDKEIAPLGIGEWTTPEGGYFISFNAPKGCAKKIVKLCAEAGVTLTGAGATFPYGVDPEDKNIRLAPTYPTIEELAKAMELFVICVKIAAAEKLLAE